MPPPFRQIARSEFAPLLERFPFSRQINAVHMHHTFRPDIADYDVNDGHRSIVGMFLFHTQTNGWRDIAQHITIAPDGSIWLGRNWNLPPASAAGHNGNAARGPFMFEIIGNFDHGRDRLEGEQRRTVVEVIATLQSRFGLAPESLRFHNTMSPKSCPGTAVDYDAILAEVSAFDGTRSAATPAIRGATRGPFPADAIDGSPAIEEALRSLSRDIPRGEEPGDAEPDHEGMVWPYEPSRGAGSRAAGDELSAATLAELRPHIVNLNRGRLSSDGKWKTDKGDVDAIFDQHLERALADAQAKGETLRVLFFAHGGLVKESAGLTIAHKHLEFWRKNGIYPISFVWETGLFETLGQLLRRSQDGTRNLLTDRITDPLTESVVRALQGPRVWGGMKQSAELAVADAASLEGKGGARYVAEKLAAFCARHAGANLELHAVGHSAGSIFHAHFIPTALSLGAPSFKSTHLLAPAIRTDAFSKFLAPRVGQGIDRMTLYTMSKDYERDDNCAKVYRKSLLYLIYHALEADRETPILGLEQSLRDDPALVTLFGLGTKPGAADVVFSVSPILTGRSASGSTTHGGFDDDPPTMGSVARRILGKQDADPIFEYVAPRSPRGVDPWANQVDWPEGVTPLAPVLPPAPTRPAIALAQPAAPAVIVAGAANGRRRALCIGINEYPTAPLLGCVADASDWAQALTQRGFETLMLENSRASREGILRGVDDLLDGSRPGDVLVLQFAGHGTQVPDLNGDEDDQTDEALCPFDFATGALLIDDDIREVFDRIPDGVNFTCFFDCCHSGTNTRFAVGAGLDGSQGRDRRMRFMRATPELLEAHRRFRGGNGGSRAPMPGAQSAMRNVSFSACEPFEVAFESDGHGDFTVRAMRVFSAGVDGLSNEQFQQRVLAGFGAGRRQSPRLDCATAAGPRGFLLAL